MKMTGWISTTRCLFVSVVAFSAAAEGRPDDSNYAAQLNQLMLAEEVPADKPTAWPALLAVLVANDASLIDRPADAGRTPRAVFVPWPEWRDANRALQDHDDDDGLDI